MVTEALQAGAKAEAERVAQAFLATPPEPPEAIFDSLYASLPRSYAWQREEVRAAGAQGH